MYPLHQDFVETLVIKEVDHLDYPFEETDSIPFVQPLLQSSI